MKVSGKRLEVQKKYMELNQKGVWDPVAVWTALHKDHARRLAKKQNLQLQRRVAQDAIVNSLLNFAAQQRKERRLFLNMELRDRSLRLKKINQYQIRSAFIFRCCILL